MGVYSATVVVDGFDLENERQNAGLECLSYAAVVGRSGGVVTIDADIAADSSIDAYAQLHADLRGLGVSVVRIDPDLVNVSEIADRLNVSRETVRLWTVGKRRAGFPSFYCQAGDSRLWSWSEVFDWAVTAGLDVGEYLPMPFAEIEALNGALAHKRHVQDEGWLKPGVSPRAHFGIKRAAHVSGWRQYPAARVA